jgi:hypothetical protein
VIVALAAVAFGVWSLGWTILDRKLKAMILNFNDHSQTWQLPYSQDTAATPKGLGSLTRGGITVGNTPIVLYTSTLSVLELFPISPTSAYAWLLVTLTTYRGYSCEPKPSHWYYMFIYTADHWKPSRHPSG